MTRPAALSPTQSAHVFSLDSGALLVVRLDGSTQVVQPMPRLVGDRATNLLRVVRDWADDIERACQPAPVPLVMPKLTDQVKLSPVAAPSESVVMPLSVFYVGYAEFGIDRDECETALAETGAWTLCPNDAAAIRVELVR